MRWLVALALVACGGTQKPDTGTGSSAGSAEPVVRDTRTEIEKRRDAACVAIQPRLTDCAVADAKKTMSKTELDKLKPDELRDKHKQKFLEQCKGSQMSSRQVRVLEVCFKAETECDPLADCLANLTPKK